jgi:phospholipid transport system substrate-binding protein
MSKFAPVAFVSATLCIALTAPAARANSETESYIQKNLDKGFSILNNKVLSDAERREQFRALLLSLAASRRIALFTLGSYAMSATPDAVENFVAAFTNYSISIFEKGLSRYEGQTLKVTGSMDRAADDSVVQAELASPSHAQPTKVAFRVRRSETGAPTITDLLIEGVSLATTERNDFTAFLQRHEGKVSELTTRLNEMSDKRETLN